LRAFIELDDPPMSHIARRLFHYFYDWL